MNFLNRIFEVLPKPVVIVLAIVGVILLLLLSDPPHSVCDSQLNVFRQSQQKFLFLNEDKPVLKTTKYNQLVKQCKATNDPGGCYELFQEMRKMLKDLEVLPSQCLGQAGEIEEVEKALHDASELLARLAWGAKAPETYNQKYGWLDRSDIELFCRLKYFVIATYDNDEWEEIKKKVFSELPGIKEKSREDGYDLSLFSERCQR